METKIEQETRSKESSLLSLYPQIGIEVGRRGGVFGEEVYSPETEKYNREIVANKHWPDSRKEKGALNDLRVNIGDSGVWKYAKVRINGGDVLETPVKIALTFKNMEKLGRKVYSIQIVYPTDESKKELAALLNKEFNVKTVDDKNMPIDIDKKEMGSWQSGIASPIQKLFHLKKNNPKLLGEALEYINAGDPLDVLKKDLPTLDPIFTI